MKKTLLNHELCKIIIEDGKTQLFIKMQDGRFAVQRPYENDLRGHIGALQLALDVLSGKIILGTVTTLDESAFSEKNLGALEAPKVQREPEVIEAPKVQTVQPTQPKGKKIL